MICDGCGASAPALKTVICRDDADRRGVLCDPCHAPLAHRLWVVPGPVACFGRCLVCGEWESARDLADRKLGGGHGAWLGTCRSCL